MLTSLGLKAASCNTAQTGSPLTAALSENYANLNVAETPRCVSRRRTARMQLMKRPVQSFKGVLARSLPYLYRTTESEEDKSTIEELIRNSVQAMVVSQCL